MSSPIVLLTLTIGAIQAQESERLFSVTDYGANTDGVVENAASIQKAIDAAAAAGGGVVLFPAGEYRTTTIFLKDNVTLRLAKGATIKASPDYDAYPADIESPYETFLLRKDRYPSRVLIVGLKVDNVAIEGEGTVDGNGDHPNLRKKRMEAINLIRFIGCRNVRLEDLLARQGGEGRLRHDQKRDLPQHRGRGDGPVRHHARRSQ